MFPPGSVSPFETGMAEGPQNLEGVKTVSSIMGDVQSPESAGRSKDSDSIVEMRCHAQAFSPCPNSVRASEDVHIFIT